MRQYGLSFVRLGRQRLHKRFKLTLSSFRPWTRRRRLHTTFARQLPSCYSRRQRRGVRGDYWIGSVCLHAIISGSCFLVLSRSTVSVLRLCSSCIRLGYSTTLWSPFFSLSLEPQRSCLYYFPFPYLCASMIPRSTSSSSY